MTPAGNQRVHLVHAISYEERGLNSLSHILTAYAVEHVHLLIFPGEKYLDKGQLNHWQAQFVTSKALLELHKIPYQEFPVRDTGPAEWSFLDDCQDPDAQILVNISTIPKIFIMAFVAKLWHRPGVAYYYQPLIDHQAPESDKDESGVSEVLVVDGLEGKPELGGREQLMVMLGYEGERALRCWRQAAPGATIIGIVGLPDWRGDPWETVQHDLSPRDRQYLEVVTRRNRRLIQSQGARLAWVNSLDAGLCLSQLNSIWGRLEGEGKVERETVLLPLGTKAQAVAGAAFAIQHTGIQVLYGVPNRRPTMLGKPGPAVVFRQASGTWNASRA